MADLMAKYPTKPRQFDIGENIQGAVITITDREIIIDLGSKSEGILNKKELSPQDQKSLKIGDKIDSFVAGFDHDFGQVFLTKNRAQAISKQASRGGRVDVNAKLWPKLSQAKDNKQKLKGEIVEVNKGGLMVALDQQFLGKSGMKGFLPVSQLGFTTLKKAKDKGGWENLVGEVVAVLVIEVDPQNRKLILSSREEITPQIKEKVLSYQQNQKVLGKIICVVPFGIVVSIDPSKELGTGGIEGFIHIQEVAWEKVENLDNFKIDQEVEAQVLGIDQDLGRVNLSLRQLQKDPFVELVQKLQPDDVVSGTITEITQAGVNVALSDNLQGFMPAEKVEQGINYTVGEKINFLVDSVDQNKRKINLVPFVTSTKGLIYK